MIDEIFSCPVRKYNISDPDVKDWAHTTYEKDKLELKSPFRKVFDNSSMDTLLTQIYVDVLENFVKEIGLEKTHVGLITGAILCVLEKGESLSLCNTLPSHYTFTHYIEGISPDVFYHPARQLLEVFNPGLDEWSNAVSLYTNEGDVIAHPSYLDYITPPVESKRITMTLMVQLVDR
tara:strand:- start:42 stop:572 length:531 start_codon:yes stop_codon:yes gene_type:complete